MNELILSLEPLRASADNIVSIINKFKILLHAIFNGEGFFVQLIRTISGNSFLLIGVSLMICGYVIGLLSRMIHN